MRFKKLDDLALDVIGEAIKRVPAKKYVEICEAAHKPTARRKSADADKAGSSAGSPGSGKSLTPARKGSRRET